jgi:Protein ChrB, N-terminal
MGNPSRRVSRRWSKKSRRRAASRWCWPSPTKKPARPQLEALFTGQREAEWGEFLSDCGKYETELAGEIAKGKLTLAELDEEEQSLDRLRRWYRTIRARDRFGAASAPVAERRLKECTEALEDFAERVYQARERP